MYRIIYNQVYDRRLIKHLFVDDASNDNTDGLIYKWLEQHPDHNVEYVSHKTRLGGTDQPPIVVPLFNLMQPLAEESPHPEYFEAKGECIQHIMVSVDDIEKEIKRLTDKGCTLLLDIRMPGGIHGAYIDLHAGGIIVEMFQQRSD